MRSAWPLLTILLLACSATEPQPETGSSETTFFDWRFSDEEDGLFLAWQPAGGEVPRNREFELRAVLLQDGQAPEGARLSVRGWMPDHQHGLVKDPQVLEDEDGFFRVQGLLLHMRGSWELIFDVFHGTTKTSFSFELEV